MVKNIDYFFQKVHTNVSNSTLITAYVDTAPSIRHLRAIVVGQGNNCVKLWIGSWAERGHEWEPADDFLISCMQQITFESWWLDSCSEWFHNI